MLICSSLNLIILGVNKSITKHLWPIELVMLAYIGITFLFIVINYSHVPNTRFSLIIRIIIILFITLLPYLKIKDQIKSIIRLYWPLLVIGYFYTETDALNNIIFKQNLDANLAQFEFFIFGIQPAQQFSLSFPQMLFAEFMYFGYFSYYLLIFIIPFAVLKNRSLLKAQHLIFILISSFLIYYATFIIFPASGPQYFFENSLATLPKGYLFGKLIRIIQHIGEAPTAAFPSSHVSICLMIAWYCYRNLKGLLPIVLPISILLIASTVYIKAHYLIDVLAAFLTTPVIYYLTNRLFKYLNLKQYANKYP